MNRERLEQMNLVVLVGSTAVGKTGVAVRLAKALGCHVLNCDSRQIYRGMDIGTAAPDEEEMDGVVHHFVRMLDPGQPYSAARYEEDALSVIRRLSCSQRYAVLSGGSMMYVDAVCHGIDDIPTVDAQVRDRLSQRYGQDGLEPLLAELQRLDPQYYCTVDRMNHKRVIHALEICLTSGRAYSTFRMRARKDRPFNIIKVGLRRERAELFARVNARADRMMERGFLDEARSLYSLRGLNALNTIGYKEMFKVLAGEWELPMAVERMKKNTRVYAKKQMTWYQRDKDITWFHPDEMEAILAHIIGLSRLGG